MKESDFKIFFLCEDWHSLTRASALHGRLKINCQGQVIVEADFCEFARLCHPRLRENATQHAIESNIIIVSARGTAPVPVFVQNWMNEIGALCMEKIVCAEFLDTGSADEAKTFHRFMDKWSSQRGSFLFSNLFPDVRVQAAGLPTGSCPLPPEIQPVHPKPSRIET